MCIVCSLTAVSHAARLNRTDLLELLLQHSARTDLADSKGTLISLTLCDGLVVVTGILYVVAYAMLDDGSIHLRLRLVFLLLFLSVLLVEGKCGRGLR